MELSYKLNIMLSKKAKILFLAVNNFLINVNKQGHKYTGHRD